MAAQNNIISDVSNYTRIPLKVLNEVIEKEELCIGSALHDAVANGESAVVLNIGFGTLSIELSTMQCKFVPSRELRSILKRSVEDGVDPLLFTIEQSIINKLISICEDTI